MNTLFYSNVHIRRIGENRIDDLLALEEACFETDRSSRRNLRNLLRSASVSCLGAYHRGAVVGSAVILFRAGTRSARIYSLAVDASARGLGVGRRMMERAEKEARLRGCDRLRLEVRMDNIPAIRLYERFGFASTHVLNGYYEDGAHAFVMRKELI